MLLAPAEGAAVFQFCTENILGHVALESICKPSRIPPNSAGIREDNPEQRDTFVFFLSEIREQRLTITG